MKKGLLLFSTIALMSLSSAFAQEATTKAAKAKTTGVVTKAPEVETLKKLETVKVDGAGMTFEQETIDYGIIEHNADGKREFVLVNTGTKPLIITDCKGSCGCTVPTWPKEPIAPGAKAVIGVKYATDRVGAFTKNVTVTSNASETPKVLTIKGTVKPDPNAPAKEEPTKS
jgi:hypothetical protein